MPQSPGDFGPSSRLFVGEANVIVFPAYGFEFRIPPQWRLEKYLPGEGITQEGSTIVDRSEELSRFIELRHREVIDAEMDLALMPDFDDDDLPMLPYKEYVFGEGDYRARYVASCTGDKLIYIESRGKSLMARPAEFCDTPAYKAFDIDATFRAIAEGFRFAE